MSNLIYRCISRFPRIITLRKYQIVSYLVSVGAVGEAGPGGRGADRVLDDSISSLNILENKKIKHLIGSGA
jgi:hypothetical protein